MVLMWGKRKPSEYQKRKYAYAKLRIPKWPRMKPSNYRTGGYVGQELRYCYTSVTGGTIPVTVATAVVDNTASNCLSFIDQGTGQTQRTGLRAVFKSMHVRGNIHFRGGSIGVLTRILLVQDKQTNGAQMVGTDVLDPTMAGTNNDDLNFPNLENKHRFKIWYDRTIKGPSRSADAGVVDEKVPFKIDLQFGKRGIVCRYLGPGNTITDRADNSFHLLMISSDATTPVTLYNYQCKTRFLAN